LFAAVLGALVSVLYAGRALAQQPDRFALSPDPLSLTATVGSDGIGLVTVTPRRTMVIISPASFGTTLFSDTRNGSCWQDFESLGRPISRQAACTIEVRFHPTAAGTFNDTMTVTACQSWHRANGQIVCDVLGGSQTVAVTGTATGGEPDLTVGTIVFSTPSGYPPESYTVTISNVGSGPADLSNVIVQGYYSTDTTIGGSDLPACGLTLSGTLAAGASIDVPVGCSEPRPSGEYLIVEVDASNALTESNEANNTGYVLVP
jgi:hypothetical protein